LPRKTLPRETLIGAMALDGQLNQATAVRWMQAGRYNPVKEWLLR